VAGLTSEVPGKISLMAESVGLRRGNGWLFRGLSFSVRAGEIVWIRGHNGCGKTSLMRLLVGLEQPDEGRVVGCRGGVDADHAAVLPNVYIGHANGLKEDLTCTESLQFLAHIHSQNANVDAVSAALRRLDVHHKRNSFVRTLSQGQRRRVALARLALEQRPSVWVLDEPLDTLDQTGMDTVHSLVHDHCRLGGSVVLSSHIALSSPLSQVRMLELSSLVSQ